MDADGRPGRGRADGQGVLAFLVLVVCGGVLLQAFGLEPFQVPTGSMAPTLRGHHHVCICPRCGLPVAVGRLGSDAGGWADDRRYARSFCPNCGTTPLPIGEMTEAAGDHVLVNRVAFTVRQPRRWEVVVLRLFGKTFIKRVVGLPGDELLLKDGDVYDHGRLVRKSFTQAWALRVPIFDGRFRPASGSDDRWQRQPSGGAIDVLDGRERPATWTLCSGAKCQPLRDEYAYDAGLHGGRELVHDFMFEADVTVVAGQGMLALRLTDGADWIEASLPAVQVGSVATRSWPVAAPSPFATVVTHAPFAPLQRGRRYHVVMGFVDRRLSLEVDGRVVLENLDWPLPEARTGTGQPVQLQATGIAARVENFRLYRDIHYSQQGRHAVGGEPVHLEAEQYFVLGDNSANSEDSRCWPCATVAETQLVGPAFFVHLASQPSTWHWAGLSGRCQLPDPARMRWLR